MELDDLKKIMQKNITLDTISEESFKEVKARKSLHPAEKIKRKVLYENLLSLVLGICLVAYIIIYKSTLPLFVDLLVLSITIISLAFGFGKVYQLHQLLKYSSNTKVFLINFNKAIKGYIKIFTVSAIIFFPVGLYIGYTLGYSSGSDLEYSDVLAKFMEKPKYLIYEVAFAIPLTIGAYYLTRKIYSKLYGKQIAEIEQLLLEIE